MEINGTVKREKEILKELNKNNIELVYDRDLESDNFKEFDLPIILELRESGYIRLIFRKIITEGLRNYLDYFIFIDDNASLSVKTIELLNKLEDIRSEYKKLNLIDLNLFTDSDFDLLHEYDYLTTKEYTDIDLKLDACERMCYILDFMSGEDFNNIINSKVKFVSARKFNRKLKKYNKSEYYPTMLVYRDDNATFMHIMKTSRKYKLFYKVETTFSSSLDFMVVKHYFMFINSKSKHDIYFQTMDDEDIRSFKEFFK